MNQNHLKKFHTAAQTFLSPPLICHIAAGKGESPGQRYELRSHIADSFLFGQRTAKHTDALKT